ncbi:MAG: DUF3783 domain-containing protein [Oscillospiraceae bacterium]|nr:DUF3783 domain-containing protein [Oscillospiraceae bacterium]
MKARVRIENPKIVLYYGLDGEKREKTCAVLEKRGLAVREILPQEAGERVGYLTGCAGFDPAPAKTEAPAGECLVLSGLEERELRALLEELRGAGVEIPLKAVATGTNRNWPFARLLEELGREREAIRRMQGK